jgi:hypothetical protein
MGRPGGPREGVVRDIGSARSASNPKPSRYGQTLRSPRPIGDINSERSPAYAKYVFDKDPHVDEMKRQAKLRGPAY